MLVPGRSLGGIELGMTKAALERSWGRAYGVCKGLPARDVVLQLLRVPAARRGRRVARRQGRRDLHALPAGRLAHEPGLRLGDPETRVTSFYGALVRRQCGGYSVLLLPGRAATTAFYVLDDRLWAFGLYRPGLPLCRA